MQTKEQKNFVYVIDLARTFKQSGHITIFVVFNYNAFLKNQLHTE